MKLLPETMNILKNFSTINSAIQIKEGNVLKTIAQTKAILGKATIPQAFESTFCIYDLSSFISAISMIEEADLTFGDPSFVTIRSDASRRAIQYKCCESNVFMLPPEKDINIPGVEVSFDVKQKTIADLSKALNVLGLPEFAIIGDGSDITLQALDSKKGGSSYSEVVGASEKVFAAYIRADNLKILQVDYTIDISSKGIIHLKNPTVEYWIALEAASQF